MLDEPTVGVDPQTRVFLLEQVRQLARQGAAIVYATHYMDEAMAVCNDILILDHGRVVASGDLADAAEGDRGLRPVCQSRSAVHALHPALAARLMTCPWVR